MSEQVYDLPVDVEWEHADPSSWRGLPEPDDGDLDDDQEEVNKYVSDVIGVNIDRLFAEE